VLRREANHRAVEGLQMVVQPAFFAMPSVGNAEVVSFSHLAAAADRIATIGLHPPAAGTRSMRADLCLKQ